MHLSDETRQQPSAHSLTCQSCGGGALQRDKIKTAIWSGDDLVVVEDIPALVCRKCGERYYEDETAMALDIMRGKGFLNATSAHTITVPVFKFVMPEHTRSRGKKR